MKCGKLREKISTNLPLMSLEVEDSIFFSHYREMVDSDFEVYSKKDTQIYKYRETRG